MTGTSAAVGWDPIGHYNHSGDNSAFTSSFNGNGHKISNLYINRRSTNGMGLFAYLAGASAVLRNLGLEDVNVSGDDRVGGFAARCDMGGVIRGSYSTGNLSGQARVGGLVGTNSCTISTSYSTANVEGRGGNQVGGLLGWNDGKINATYATGNVTSGGENSGGLVGQNLRSIVACYASGNVVSTRSSVGGLLGWTTASIKACYATGNVTGISSSNLVGGLLGKRTGGSITSSYYSGAAITNTNLSGSVNTLGSAQAAIALQTPTAYDGLNAVRGTAIYLAWNVDVDKGLPVGIQNALIAGDPAADDPWDFGTTTQYPALQVDFNGDGLATAFEFGGQGRTGLSLSAAPGTIVEGEVSTITLTFSEAPVAGDLVVPLAISGTTDGADYTLAIGTGLNPVASVSATMIRITRDGVKTSFSFTFTAVDDADGAETATIALGSPLPSGYVEGLSPTVDVVINPLRRVSLSASDASILEGGVSTLTLTFSPAPAAGATVAVPLAITGTGIETTDYTLAAASPTTLSGTTITVTGDGSTTAFSFTFMAVNDADGAETATIALGSLPPGYVEGSSPTVDVVINPVTEVSLSASPTSIVEGGVSTLTLTFSPAPANLASVTVPLAITGGVVAGDYSLAAGAGTSRSDNTITVTGDGTTTAFSFTFTAVDDADGAETATLTLGTLPSGYTAGTPATVDVVINPLIEVSLSASDASIVEGGVSTLTLTFSPAPANSATVDVPLAISGSGITNADYTLAIGTVTSISATEITVTGNGTTTAFSFTFTAVNDTDGAETATLTLGTLPSGYTAGTPVTVDVMISPMNDMLIDISTLDQLHAIRYDLDGDGVPTAAGLDAYNTAFGTAVSVGDTDDAEADAPNDPPTKAGYKLMANLDFNDQNNDGTADDPSAWSADCISGCSEASGGVAGTSATVGWAPIGASPSSSFIGVFHGNEHTISNLYINRDAQYVGLFGCLGDMSTNYSANFLADHLIIRNLGLKDVSVTSTATSGSTDRAYTGGLLGENGGGTIAASYVSGSVRGSNGDYAETGGLVGENAEGKITTSYATASVIGGNGGNAETGGLVGGNDDMITASYSTASVIGGNGGNAETGGLVGGNDDMITASYSTASVIGGNGGNAETGGLVGKNDGFGGNATIRACYSTGSVTGGSTTGGLVGSNSSATLENSYFDDTMNSSLSAIGSGSGMNVSGKTSDELKMPTAYSTASGELYYEWNRNIDGDLDTDAADVVWDFGGITDWAVLKNIDANGDGMIDASDLAAQRMALSGVPATLAAPTSLATGSVTGTSVKLSWDAYAGTNTGFKVYYSQTMGFSPPAGMEFVPSPTLAAGDTTVVVTGLSVSTVYYFKVAAVNGGTVGTYATEVSAMTSATTPVTTFFVAPEMEAPRMYPNPTSRELRFVGLSSARRYVYKIYSLVGQKVLSGSLHSRRLDLRALSSAKYILVLEDEKGNEVLRAGLLILK